MTVTEDSCCRQGVGLRYAHVNDTAKSEQALTRRLGE